LIAWILPDSRWDLRPVKGKTLALYAAGSLAAFVIWLAAAAHCIVIVSTRGEAFFPIWLAGDVAAMVERAGGRVAALERYGVDAVRLALANMPGAAVAEIASITLLLLAFSATFIIPTLPLLRRKDGRGRSDLEMLSVFISYRREDSAPYARLIFERLQPACRHVVLDVDVLPIGSDFERSIERAIDASDVVMVVIGPNWLGCGDGRPRIAEAGDVVAWEIVQGLAKGKALLPVLVQGARMPSADEVPIAIAPLTKINAAELRHESFKRDFVQLEEYLEALGARMTRTIRD
jgi:hypothetical protein